MLGMKCIPNKRQSAWLQTGRVRATAACTSKHSQKIFMLQSAMEYLMTYSWAILIMAVVIGALYYMGIFGSATSGQRVQPGSCRVFRPNGPSTTAYINLEGICTGRQLPQYVASFDGASSYVQLPSSIRPTGPFSISLWVNPSSQASPTSSPIIFGGGRSGYGNGVTAGFCSGCSPSTDAWLWVYNSVYFSFAAISENLIPIGSWTHVVVMWDGYNAYFYTNGVFRGGTSIASLDWTNSPGLRIGYGYGTSNHFNGSIANFQIYNTTLDSNAIQNLYNEGIGGVPIPLQYLVGWWPLNGNANDYSGDNNNGASTSVMYTSSWTSAYQGH
jgi:Concanavalin A-like lectin/glucanases superfamily